jgi:hypothetical protein
MTRTTLRVEECCEWCRQPVERCRDASCDDAGTYDGVLHRGEWRRVEESQHETSSANALRLAA